MADEKPQISYTERTVNFIKNSGDYFNNIIDRLKNLARSNIEAGILQMRKGEYKDASIRFKIALWFEKNNPIALYLLGKSYVFAGKREKAIPPLRKALTLNPEMADAKFLLSLCGEASDLAELPRSFIIERNDTIADNYAEIYPEGIETNISKKLRDEFAKYFESWQGFNILDIGCQTGETGVLLKEKANVLVGVEPALKMVAKARMRRLNDILVYNKIVAKFPEDYLAETSENYQAVIAINYLSNFATLEIFFKLIRARIAETGGVFIFTITPTEVPNHDFAKDKIIFRHNEKYVEACLAATNFKLHKKTEITYESGLIDIIYFAETI